jgi:hypothetical protein
MAEMTFTSIMGALHIGRVIKQSNCWANAARCGVVSSAVTRWAYALLLSSCASPPLDAQPVTVPVHAPPSPAPTATPDAAVSPEQIVDRLGAISVRTRLPELAKDADYGIDDLPPFARIEEAIERAQAGMFVSYVANGAETLPAAEYRILDDGHFPPYPDSEVSGGGLARYDATTLLAYAPGNADYLLKVAFELAPLPDRAPGLVWDVFTADQRADVLFVSLDGEWYLITPKAGGPSIEVGVDPPARWPPLSNPAFGRIALSTRREQTAPLAPVDDAFAKCAERAVSRARKGMTPEQLEANPWPSTDAIRRACAKEIAAWEQTFAKNVDASIARRTALIEKAKARVTELGLAR